MSVNQSILYQIDHSIIEDIRHELALQGHYLTGALEASIKERLIHEGGAIILSAEALGYIETLEKRTPASEIRLNREEFDNLREWVIKRGIATYETSSFVASAIVKKWKQGGRPTEASNAYSQTGKRTEAINDTFDKNAGKYVQLLDHGVGSILDSEARDLKEGINATI
jgi:hypothetical protein